MKKPETRIVAIDKKSRANYRKSFVVSFDSDINDQHSNTITNDTLRTLYRTSCSGYNVVH